MGYALRQYITHHKKFPEPGRWTCEILRYTEEWALADETKNGVAKGTVLPCPRLLHCPAQDNVMSNVAEVRVCHYTVAVNRPTPKKRDGVTWKISDRPVLDDSGTYEPWYVGPEMSLLAHQRMLNDARGPHLGSTFYNGEGLIETRH